MNQNILNTAPPLLSLWGLLIGVIVGWLMPIDPVASSVDLHSPVDISYVLFNGHFPHNLT